MNAYELAYKLNNALGVDYEMLEQSSIMLRQQADRIAELEKRKWSEQDIKNACISARLSEEDFFKIKAYLPVYSSPQTNNKNRSWSDICDEATAVWDSLDTSNQSNIECARAWFLEGYHQALTRGQE